MCGKAEAVGWWMESLGKFQGQNPRGRRPTGFWPQDFPNGLHSPTHFHSFFHPWPVKGFLSANGFLRDTGVLRDTTGHYAGHMGRVKSQYAGPGCRNNGFCLVNPLHSTGGIFNLKTLTSHMSSNPLLLSLLFLWILAVEKFKFSFPHKSYKIHRRIYD